MANALTRLVAKSDADWPLADEVLPSHWLSRLVYYARLAPSTHNTQPWKFVVGRREIDVFADDARWLRVADPFRRELHISLGCAIESLRIAADFSGCGTEVTYFPVTSNSGLVARVRVLGPGSSRDDAAPELLLHTVTRRTNHRKFDPDRPVTDDERRAIYTCFFSPGVALHFINDRAALARLAEMERIADRQLFADSAYRSELAAWIGEGLLGTSWLVSKLGQFAVESLPVGRQVAQFDAGLVASTPLAAVLSTARDQPVDQVHVGEAYMRIVLLAESMELRVQPVSQILEVAETRTEVGATAGLADRYTQHLFRIGRGQAEPAVRRRRALEDIMLRSDL